MGAVVQGTLLLSVVALLAVRRWRVRREEPPPDEAEPVASAEPRPTDELGQVPG
jgi:hypothetical protein